MKTSELTGAALDWAVSTLTNPEWDYEDRAYNTFDWIDTGDTNDEQYSPSTDWSQGGPIIEREGIALWPNGTAPWDASVLNGKYVESGLTPLIAAMRCYVASKLGETAEVPEELV